MVAGFCAREHIPHSTLCPPAPITGSQQAAARTERYRLLEQWREANALDHIVTAHQDRKSTRLNPVTNAHIVCRILLEKKNTHTKANDRKYEIDTIDTNTTTYTIHN